MRTLLQDLRQAVRGARRRPGPTVLAVVALAAGIGGCATVFSAVHAILLRPLPYREPARILGIWGTAPARDLDLTPISYQRFRAIAEDSATLASVGAFTRDTASWTGGEEPLELEVGRISAGFLDTLGVAPALGRGFSLQDDEPGGPPVVLVSDRFWRARMGARPQVLGTALTLDGVGRTVLGVLPPGFRFPDTEVDVWLPRVFEPGYLSAGAVERGAGYLEVVARSKSGVSADEVQRELDRFAAADRRDAFLDAGLDYRLVPLAERLTAGAAPTLTLLAVAVGLVLAIACANLAILLLARGIDRRREVALRAALGARRGRLLRPLLVESCALALVAAAGGVVVGWWSLGALVRAAAGTLPRAAEIHFDAAALAFTALLAVAAASIFGLAPALTASRVDLVTALKAGRGGPGGRAPRRVRDALVIGEVALAAVLLVGAGLLSRSFVRLLAEESGFNPANLLVAKVSLPTSRYDQPSRIRGFFERLTGDLAGIPGVVSVGAAETLPWADAAQQTLVAVDGRPLPPLGERDVVAFDTVTPGYFRTLGIPLLEGRTFTPRDDAATPIKIVVSRAFGRRYFPQESAVGHSLLLGKSATACEIVGTVGDVRQGGLDTPPGPFFYLSAAQRTVPSLAVILRTSGPPLEASAALRSKLRAIDPDQPIASLETMDAVLERSLAGRRLPLVLLALFAATAVVLAAGGIYSVMAYRVSRRTAEIGIRLALGAQRPAVMAQVVRSSVLLASLGVALGLAAAFALTRLMASLLFEVSTTDPATFAATAAFIVALAVLASYAPARRAAGLDPVEALRSE